MLVDINAVIQCMVVSSPFSSARLPINCGAADSQNPLVLSLRLSIAADRSRYRLFKLVSDSGKKRSSGNKKRLKPGKEGSEALSLVKNKDGSHGMMKVERQWIEKFYR